jgi:glycosyltransferase involved in cell wall biosynthesis
MKVLYVLRYFPAMTETFVRNEIDELVRRGHQVQVIAWGPREETMYWDPRCSADHFYPPKGLGGLAASASGLNPGLLWRNRHLVGWLNRQVGAKWSVRVWWLVRQLNEGDFDRVHCHFAGETAEWAMVASCLASVPFSVTVHAVDLFKPRPGLGFLLQRASEVVTISEYNRRWILEAYDVEATVARCGVKYQRFTGSRKSLQGPMNLVCVARNVPKKGLDTLVNAVIRVGPSVHLRLVSNYPDPGCDWIDVGMVPPDEVELELRAADVFVLPCRRAEDGDCDGIPVALMEAMNVGLPVMTTTTSGLGELVDDEVGWIFAPDCVDTLTSTIDKAMKQSEEWSVRGQSGNQRILKMGYTLENQVNSLLKLWST